MTSDAMARLIAKKTEHTKKLIEKIHKLNAEYSELKEEIRGLLKEEKKNTLMLLFLAENKNSFAKLKKEKGPTFTFNSAKASKTIFGTVEHTHIKEWNEALNKLKGIEQYVFRLRCDIKPYTSKIIAETLSITNTKCQSIYNQAVRHLKHPSVSKPILTAGGDTSNI